MTVAIFLGSLLIAMAIGIPIAYSLLLSGIALMWHLDLFDAIIALTPETSSLARLPRPLHRLAELLGSLTLLARVHYREAASLEALVCQVAGPPRTDLT